MNKRIIIALVAASSIGQSMFGMQAVMDFVSKNSKQLGAGAAAFSAAGIGLYAWLKSAPTEQVTEQQAERTMKAQAGVATMQAQPEWAIEFGKLISSVYADLSPSETDKILPFITECRKNPANLLTNEDFLKRLTDDNKIGLTTVLASFMEEYAQKALRLLIGMLTDKQEAVKKSIREFQAAELPASAIMLEMFDCEELTKEQAEFTLKEVEYIASCLELSQQVAQMFGIQIDIAEQPAKK